MTVSDFFKTLDGSTAADIARELRLPYTTVACWVQRDRIPAWRMAEIARLAMEKGKPIPVELTQPKKREVV